MKHHFETYGWLNLLKEVAKTKVFDLTGSGQNSIDCVREAKCFDVLIFASEEKMYNEAQTLEMEQLMRK